MNRIHVLSLIATGVMLVPTLSQAQQCKEAAYLAECKPLQAAVAANLCEPERLRPVTPQMATRWTQAVAAAPELQARLEAFAQKYPDCIGFRKTSCALFKTTLRDCTDLPKKYADARKEHVSWAKKEIDRHLPGIEKTTDLAEAFKRLKNSERHFTKNLGTVLWIEPNHTEFNAIVERLRTLRKKLTAANMEEIAKVKCPASTRDKGLAKTLTGVYQKWLGTLSYPVKAHRVSLQRSVVKETDWQGTKWEYANTTTCIEDTADTTDPARCAVNEVSFKRSKPSSKGWSTWSFHGSGARNDSMLCKNL